jgi:hypothetical protein
MGDTRPAGPLSVGARRPIPSVNRYRDKLAKEPNWKGGRMGIVQTDGHWFTAYGNGYSTIDVNIPPASIYATVCLNGTSGGGTNYAGISGYRKRLPSGADQDINFGPWTSWPPSVSDFMSSITFAIATGDGQEAWLYGRMDYWE